MWGAWLNCFAITRTNIAVIRICSCPHGIHLTATIGTYQVTAEQRNFLYLRNSFSLCQPLLHTLKRVTVNDRLVCVSEHLVVLRVMEDDLLAFIGQFFRSEIHRISAVFGFGKNHNNGLRWPGIGVDLCGVIVLYATEVRRRRENLFTFEGMSDLWNTVASEIKTENQFHHIRSRFVDQPDMLVLCRLFVAVDCPACQTLSCVALLLNDCPLLTREVTAVPLVHDVMER